MKHFNIYNGHIRPYVPDPVVAAVKEKLHECV